MFLNGVLTNAEIWYNLSEAEIQEFENLDRLLLRRILQVPVSTPKEAFLLELGIIPIAVTIKARQINYLHYLVNRKQSEMLCKFFVTQANQPCKGDWTEAVKRDLEQFNIPYDFNYLKSKSKDAFKRIVKNKAKEVALEVLKAKQQKHTKMENLKFLELKRQTYFNLQHLRVEDMRNVFRFRVRMARFGHNYRGNRDNVGCPLCASHLDKQHLVFQCKEIISRIMIQCNTNDVYCDNVTMETDKTLTEIMKVCDKLWKKENG